MFCFIFIIFYMELLVGLTQGSFSHLRLSGRNIGVTSQYIMTSSLLNFFPTIHNFTERERLRDRETDRFREMQRDSERGTLHKKLT